MRLLYCLTTHVDRQCPPLPHYPPQQRRGSAALCPHWIRQKEGDTQASAKEAGNKPIISATRPLHCLPTWEYTRMKWVTFSIIWRTYYFPAGGNVQEGFLSQSWQVASVDFGIFWIDLVEIVCRSSECNENSTHKKNSAGWFTCQLSPNADNRSGCIRYRCGCPRYL